MCTVVTNAKNEVCTDSFNLITKWNISVTKPHPVQVTLWTNLHYEPGCYQQEYWLRGPQWGKILWCFHSANHIISMDIQIFRLSWCLTECNFITSKLDKTLLSEMMLEPRKGIVWVMRIATIISLTMCCGSVKYFMDQPVSNTAISVDMTV